MRVAVALAALRRFRALCDTLQVGRVFGIATAACRDAQNGPAFIEEAERICRIKIDVLSGRREAADLPRWGSCPASTSRTALPAISAAARSN